MEISQKINENKNTCKILYNSCYGGFDLSEKALSEYKKRYITSKNSSDSENSFDLDDRTNELMIQICNELGSEANGNHSCIQITEIPLRFLNYYKINEYDGAERISIDVDKYKLNSINIILKNNTLFNDEKLKLIQQVLVEDIKDYY